MIINDFRCDYPCNDVHKNIMFPKIKINPDNIKIVMISEAPPENHSDYFYESISGSFFQTTKMAFKDAGIIINNYEDLTSMGIYLTTAIKCHKIGYLVSAKTIKECSLKFLKIELAQLPNIKIIMCMGDFAIKAVNYIFKEKYGKHPIKSGSTYKIRNEEHVLNNIRFLPSYTHTGDSFNLEKSKRRMIAEDIKKALSYLKEN
jgi:uracil-DNA glycosylase